MEQTLAIKGRGVINREHIMKMQEEANRRALVKVPLFRFVLNSFITAGCITLGQIISCSLAAFSFSFLDFKGKNLLFILVMATMMIPCVVVKLFCNTCG